jgi:hypothetical protein
MRVVFVDEGDRVVYPRDVVKFMDENHASPREAAMYFGSSATTVRSFLLRNNYHYSDGVYVLNEPESREEA